jgi:polyisoprenoid-binding protein YceI
MKVKHLILIVLGVVIAGVVGGPYVYIHLLSGKAAPKLTLSSTTASPASGKGGVDGTWTVASGSIAQYRVHEILFGQSNEATGSTSAISGSLTVRGAEVVSGSFTVDMTTVKSDKERRDAQFNGRIMDTSTYPTATFELTQPIAFGAVPPPGSVQTKTATGKLTLHGTTRTVTFTVRCERNANGTAEVNGSIPIVFADYNIANPSFGPITTDDHGTLEFTLNLRHE